MFDYWVIDAGLSGPPFCLVPIEFNSDGSFDVITGMNFLGLKPPGDGKLIGVVHPEGQQAAEEWVELHREELKDYGLDGLDEETA